MKAKINVGFNAKVQALSFNPVESNDSMEIEIEYDNDKDLETKISHYQDIIRKRTIKNVMKGAEELIVVRSKTFLSDED
jgi:hypothetical protein